MSTVLHSMNDALMPRYFYARVLVNVVAIFVLLLVVPADGLFAGQRWRVATALLFSSISAVLILLRWNYRSAWGANGLLVWLVSFEFIAPCVIIGAGLQQLATFSRLEYVLYWGFVVAPDAILVLIPRSLAGVAAFYTDDGSLHTRVSF